MDMSSVYHGKNGSSRGRKDGKPLQEFKILL